MRYLRECYVVFKKGLSSTNHKIIGMLYLLFGLFISLVVVLFYDGLDIVLVNEIDLHIIIDEVSTVDTRGDLPFAYSLLGLFMFMNICIGIPIIVFIKYVINWPIRRVCYNILHIIFGYFYIAILFEQCDSKYSTILITIVLLICVLFRFFILWSFGIVWIALPLGYI